MSWDLLSVRTLAIYITSLARKVCVCCVYTNFYDNSFPLVRIKHDLSLNQVDRQTRRTHKHRAIYIHLSFLASPSLFLTSPSPFPTFIFPPCFLHRLSSLFPHIFLSVIPWLFLHSPPILTFRFLIPLSFLFLFFTFFLDPLIPHFSIASLIFQW